MYTQLGVMTKGTVIEVNVSELGMVTTGGKVVFGKYAQITNNPENDGCINAVLRTYFFHADMSLANLCGHSIVV
jgi:ribosome biogenesis protein NSA2